MRCKGPLGYALSGSAVLAILAGCSGGGGSSLPTSSSQSAIPSSTLRSAQSVVRVNQSTSLSRLGTRLGIPDLSPGFADVDAAATGAVAVSDAEADTVVVFNTKGKVVATITGFSEPQGLDSDTSGNLYVADTVNSEIKIYKDDYKTLLSTLADSGQYPAGVAYDDTTGIVAATNIISTSGGAGSVSFYAKGKKTPCVTVSNSNFARVYFDAFDASGNLYIDGSNSSGSVVVGEITGACKAKSIAILTTKNTIEFPGGVQVTPKGDIVIDDQEGLALYTYKPPVKGSLGTPVATTPLTGAEDPVTFAFTKTATDAWTADAALLNANEYLYTKGGSPIKTDTTSFEQPIGVAVTPVETP
jgi:hypothetical protein